MRDLWGGGTNHQILINKLRTVFYQTDGISHFLFGFGHGSFFVELYQQ